MPPNVVFTDPAAVRDLFTAPPDDAVVGEIAGVLEPIMGSRSVMLIDGEAHRRERRRMLPPFRGNCIRTYGAPIQDAARAMVDAWRPGEALEVLPAIHRAALEIIVRITLGAHDGPRRRELCEIVERFLVLGTSPLATAILWLVPKHRIDALVYRPVREGARLGPHAPWAAIVRAQDAMDRVLHEEIAARRAGGYEDADDLLSLLVRAKGDDGRAMSDVELRDQMVTLLLAGHETTATTLAWTIAHLLHEPGLWARTKGALPAAMDVATLTKDPWLDAVLRESMRLSPVALTVGRHLRAPMKIGRVTLPAGVNAIACAHLAQRRADLFPDPLRFSPDRWLGDEGSPYCFFPFGGGSRRCLGMALAYFEMKIVLAEIVARADLAPLSGRFPRPVRKGVTFAPENGLRVHVRAVEPHRGSHERIERACAGQARQA
jgi:cytochrome P450